MFGLRSAERIYINNGFNLIEEFGFDTIRLFKNWWSCLKDIMDEAIWAFYVGSGLSSKLYSSIQMKQLIISYDIFSFNIDYIELRELLSLLS